MFDGSETALVDWRARAENERIRGMRGCVKKGVFFLPYSESRTACLAGLLGDLGLRRCGRVGAR